MGKQLPDLDYNLVHVSDHPHEAARDIVALLHPPSVAYLHAAKPSAIRNRFPLIASLDSQLPPNAKAHCILDGAAVFQVHGLDAGDAVFVDDLQRATPWQVNIICDGTIKVPRGLPFADNKEVDPLHSVY